jgi:vacuolar-type H+-ATPase subunit H
MRKLVESKVDLYQVAVFKDKARIAWDVVNEFKACGGRFLKEEPNGLYLEVDDETARKKVSIGFRDAVKKARHLLREREEKAKKDRKRVLEHGNIQKNKVDTAATKEDDPFELFSVQNLENDNASLFLSHNHPSKKQRGCCFSAL